MSAFIAELEAQFDDERGRDLDALIDELTDAERALIDSVCSALGSLTGAELSERTRLESPWLNAREGLAPSDPSNAVITQEAMRSYYQEHPVLA